MRVTHRERGTYPQCLPAPHDQTLLEQSGIGAESIAEQFHNAIQAYIRGEIREEEMFAMMGARKVISKQDLVHERHAAPH